MARRAAGIAEDDQPALAVLRVGHWIRGAGGESEDQIEIYHDRIRQTVVARLSPQERETAHQRLAFALESSSVPDPESLAIHYQGGGSKERAAVYAADAAAKAAEALAFDRAARLYKLALELGTTDPRIGRTSHQARRRPRERGPRRGGGPRVSRCVEGDERRRSSRAAAARGRAVAAKRAPGRRTGRSPDGTRSDRDEAARHAPEGLSVVPPAPVQLSAARILVPAARRVRDSGRELLIRIDACWSVATGLVAHRHDPRSRLPDAPHASRARGRRALPGRARDGSGSRLHGLSRGVRGRGEDRETRRRPPWSWPNASGHPHALGHDPPAQGARGLSRGAMGGGLADRRSSANRSCANSAPACAWELAMVHVYSLRSLVFMGRLRELSQRLPKLRKEAGERGDLFEATSLGTRYGYIVNLMNDEPEKAAAELQRTTEQWSQQAFYNQHYFFLVGDAEINLYSGSGRVAWAGVVERWRGLERSLLRRARSSFESSRFTCAGAAPWQRRTAGTSRRRAARDLLRLAGADARRMRREKTPWGDPLAALLRAGVASLGGGTRAGVEKPGSRPRPASTPRRWRSTPPRPAAAAVFSSAARRGGRSSRRPTPGCAARASATPSA